MDVHPPHEPVHTWRDALIHLGIVTVGLFIALMLEAAVEHWHHRELVHEARENIRRELEDNDRAVKQDLTTIDGETERVKAGLETMRYMRTHPNAQGQSITLQWTFSNLSDAAWRTARETGALGYMPYPEVQSDSGVYRLQDTVTGQMDALVKTQLELLAPMFAQGEHFDDISDAEYNRMLTNTATMEMDLMTLKQIMQEIGSAI